MFVSELTPGLADAGLNSKGLISRPETLDKLTNSGVKELYIDTSLGLSSPYAMPIPCSVEALKPKVKLAQERENAESIYSEARSLMGNLIKDVKVGNAIDIAPVKELADEINTSILNNANALLCLSQIREKDQYLLEHSINVGLLMGVFARFLGFEGDELHQLVTGALLHDIGKIRVPLKVLNKPGKLTNEEWDEMRNHVSYGESVLEKSSGISDTVMSICAEHHEKLSGQGYPRGLKGAEISPAGRMAAVVDIYDAITADRVYHQGKTPFDTMKILMSLAGNHLDTDLTYHFIRCISIYPVGSLLELSNHKLGVVVQVNYHSPKSPIVKTFYNNRARHFETSKIVDLSSPHTDVMVTDIVDPKPLGINLNDFL